MSDEDGRPKSEVTRIQAVAAVVPLHAATGPVKRGPGRPRRINPKPTVDDLAYHAEMQQRKAEFIDSDVIVGSIGGRKESAERLQALQLEIAKEAASLLFSRIDIEKYGKDSTQVSSRRIAALREVASIELEIKKLGVAGIDLSSERFQRVFAFFIETLKEAASEVLTTEQLDLLFNRLETKLDGWETKAQDLVR
jgi:isopropylmalate/homocitrate/citramalate synthase